MAQLVRDAMRKGYGGLEFAEGIPGTVGGAVVMNAGAYGFSISDAMVDVLVYDEAGLRMDPPEGWRFRYRGSLIPEGAAVAELQLRLRPGDAQELGSEIRELQLQRVRSQPGGRNAGCVFKNPPGAPAGRVIDQLGLKGTRIGGALVSERHANFVVNDRQARAQDVLDLLELVRERVPSTFSARGRASRGRS